LEIPLRHDGGRHASKSICVPVDTCGIPPVKVRRKPVNSETNLDATSVTGSEWSSWSALGERIRAADASAVEELYAIVAKEVRYYLWSQVGPQDLDDGVHDIILTITQSIQKDELREPERLMGLVRAIARRRVAAMTDDAVQTRSNQVDPYSRIDISVHQPDPESRVIEQENRELVMRVLGSLHKRDREVLRRFYLQEQSSEQICQEMDLTARQFRLIKTRAKARFVELRERQLATRSGHSRETKDSTSGFSSDTASETSSHVIREPAKVSKRCHPDDAVLAHAVDTFGSQEKANHWLRRPNHVFQGRTPLEVIGIDPQSVEIELTRIDHGVYI
jgi:RNA polymerase sigma-70 factor (ECF subfamily)